MLTVEDSLAWRVHRAARRLRQGFIRLTTSASLDLTQETWFILNKLRNGDGSSQGALGDDLLDDRPNVARMVAALERRGLVVREVDDDDARRRLVFLNETGAALHDQMAGLAAAERERLFGDLDETDVVAFLRVLDHLESRLA